MTGQSVGALFAASILVGSLVGCSRDELFGPGGDVVVQITTPSGIQTGDVHIVFTLESEDVVTTDVTVRYSTDGMFFSTASQAAGSVGTSGLAVGPAGTTHTFIWDSATDLGGVRASEVVVRVNPDAGLSETTSGFALHNFCYLAVTHDADTARVSLYTLDINEGGVLHLQTLGSGGKRPWDVIFEHGYFFVANRDSDDVSVLRLDEYTEELVAVEGSPFGTDGAGSQYLATDGEHLFVSNVTGGTITIHDVDEDTGRLDLNAHSGESAAGCRSLVVKSGRLYVASETEGSILIFDIAASGELQPSGFSPITSGGVLTPVALALLGNRLYAANSATATVVGYNVLGDGDLGPIAGSPFSHAGAGTLQVAGSSAADRIFLGTSSVSTFASMGLDAIGVATEDASSPHAVGGTAHTVAAKGEGGVVANGGDGSFAAWIVAATGTLTGGDDNPIDLGEEVGRIAISD